MKKIRSRSELSSLFRLNALKKGLSTSAIRYQMVNLGLDIQNYNLVGYLKGSSLPEDPETFTALCQVLDVQEADLDMLALISSRYYRTYGIKEAVQSPVQGLAASSANPLASAAEVQYSPYPGFCLKNGEVMVGASAAMAPLFSQLEKIVSNPNQDAPILITGETGTGKELVARALHYNGARKDQPFVGLNVNTVTETLLESELFGHKQGAFTDAKTDSIGFLESVDGGTILLDEIGSLPLTAQAKLLRVLQEKYFYRVGDTKSRPFTGRIIAATKEDLQKKVKEGSFREDLWYRLDVVQLHIPPLRERKEDLPLLFQYFVDRYNAKYGTSYPSEMAAGDQEALQQYHFPGNVRELEHLITRAIFADPEAQRIQLASSILDDYP